MEILAHCLPKEGAIEYKRGPSEYFTNLEKWII